MINGLRRGEGSGQGVGSLVMFAFLGPDLQE